MVGGIIHLVGGINRPGLERSGAPDRQPVGEVGAAGPGRGRARVATMMFSMCLEDGPKPTAIRVLKDQIAATEKQFDGANDEAYRAYARKMLMQLYYNMGTLLLACGPEDRRALVDAGDVAVEAKAAAAGDGGRVQADADAAVVDEAGFYLSAAIEAAPERRFPEAEEGLAAAAELLRPPGADGCSP